MNKKIQILSFLFLGFSSVAFSQIKEEKLILDKKREPEVKKIEKKKTSVETIKNYPPKEKKIQDSLNLKYDISDVSAVSDFKPTSIQGSDISPKFTQDYSTSYVQLGMGNYGNILADANISTILESNMEVGVDAHFLSTNGLKKLYPWSSKQNTTDLGLFLNNYGEKGKFNINAEYSATNYNYYGIYAMSPASDLNLKQGIDEIKVNGYYDFYSNNILNDVRVKSSFLNDTYKSKESGVALLANLSKHSVSVKDDIVLNADLGLGVETLKSTFKHLNENSTDYLKGMISPKLTFFKGESYLKVGVDINFLNSKHSGKQLLEQEKSNDVYFFPQAELQITPIDAFKFYAGVDGGLDLNSYSDMLQDNPYLAPDQLIKATETKYHFYVGIKGDVNETLKYDVSAGFAKANNIMFFKANDLFNTDVNSARYAYDFANSFSAAYDNGTISTVKANLNYFPLANLLIDGELKFSKYNLDNHADIYYVPLVSASFGAKYTMLDKKLLLGFKALFSSDRKTNAYEISEDLLNPGSYRSTLQNGTKVGGYADLNLSAEYKFHKNFSIFANGNNLLNSNYQIYKGYKVLGAQVLGGIKITF